MKKVFTFAIYLLSSLISTISYGQKLNPEQFKPIADSIQAYFKPKAFVVGKIAIVSAEQKGNAIHLNFNSPLSEYSFRKDNIRDIYTIARSLMPEKYKNSPITIFSNRSAIDEFIPPFFRDSYTRPVVEKQKLTAKQLRKERRKKATVIEEPLQNLITKESSPLKISAGLLGRHIAMWQSHGYYYEQKLLRWEWQRARIFQTVEDLYTQSYVLPYLVPMLENAGANVLLPRERDVQPNEIIVDNDNSTSGYSEVSGEKRWNHADSLGFSNIKDVYLSGDNPFRMGSARVVSSIDKGNRSYATWTPGVPVAGEYAVYVSYQSLPGSSQFAEYTVNYAGGSSKFRVNQKMGGGTWIYLGTFYFAKGSITQNVTLSNLTHKKGEIISADAVKFGGGMGNIARKPAEQGSEMNRPSSSTEPIRKIVIPINVEPVISGYPRFTEGARYWLQWAGYSDTIYSPNKNANDYNDDYMSRGRWVNVLSGGSKINPKEKGKNIPLDMAFAFHTDAGTTRNDSIIGTLGIYTRYSNDSDLYPNGENRINGRYLTDMIQSQIVDDIRSIYEPIWQRRGIWDRSYSESRNPVVPTMLLELLSHQNLADMRYGLDPQFRFTVSRAIYKGILKYLSHYIGVPYVVQPLPVTEFSATLYNGIALLRWSEVTDSLESTAKADKYILYTRINGEGFDNGRVVDGTSVTVDIEKGKIYSFKISAANNGGESFPSEILSVYQAPEEKGKVLIVNGFTKISAASSFATPDTTMGGFMDFEDHGVPYIRDISYIGSQYEFRRAIPWMDDDSPGFGASYADYETRVIAGNSFDYPYIHGKSFAKAGYSFVSCSRESVENGKIDLVGYKMVDFIMGKQRQYQIGRGVKAPKFAVFSKGLRDAISNYTSLGGNVLISGTYIATDVWDSIINDKETQDFVTGVLKYKWRTHYASKTGTVKGAPNPYSLGGNYSFHTIPNETVYCAGAPDGIEPAGEGAWTIFRYGDNNISAGVAYSGSYKTISLGFPVETLKTEQEIDSIIEMVINFFNPGDK